MINEFWADENLREKRKKPDHNRDNKISHWNFKFTLEYSRLIPSHSHSCMHACMHACTYVCMYVFEFFVHFIQLIFSFKLQNGPRKNKEEREEEE